MDVNEAAKEYSGKESHPLNNAFIAGARWVENNLNVIDFAYLQNWYQDSIDSTKEPIWTDKHLKELFEDFYLIPKK